MRASHPTREKAAPFGGCLAGVPLRGDLIRRFAPPVRFAVPEKCCGRTLTLAFFDRFRNCGFPSYATGGGNPQFPVRGEGFGQAADNRPYGENRVHRRAAVAAAPTAEDG